MNVSTKVLEKIISWLNYHKDDRVINELEWAATFNSSKVQANTDVPEWDDIYTDVEQTFLFDNMTAADFFKD